MMQHPWRNQGLYEQAARSPLGSFAMWSALPPSDYYDPSAPGRHCGATHRHGRRPGSHDLRHPRRCRPLLYACILPREFPWSDHRKSLVDFQRIGYFWRMRACFNR